MHLVAPQGRHARAFHAGRAPTDDQQLLSPLWSLLADGVLLFATYFCVERALHVPAGVLGETGIAGDALPDLVLPPLLHLVREVGVRDHGAAQVDDVALVLLDGHPHHLGRIDSADAENGNVDDLLDCLWEVENHALGEVAGRDQPVGCVHGTAGDIQGGSAGLLESGSDVFHVINGVALLADVLEELVPGDPEDDGEVVADDGLHARQQLLGEQQLVLAVLVRSLVGVGRHEDLGKEAVGSVDRAPIEPRLLEATSRLGVLSDHPVDVFLGHLLLHRGSRERIEHEHRCILRRHELEAPRQAVLPHVGHLGKGRRPVVLDGLGHLLERLDVGVVVDHGDAAVERSGDPAPPGDEVDLDGDHSNPAPGPRGVVIRHVPGGIAIRGTQIGEHGWEGNPVLDFHVSDGDGVPYTCHDISSFTSIPRNRRELLESPNSDRSSRRDGGGGCRGAHRPWIYPGRVEAIPTARHLQFRVCGCPTRDPAQRLDPDISLGSKSPRHLSKIRFRPSSPGPGQPPGRPVCPSQRTATLSQEISCWTLTRAKCLMGRNFLTCSRAAAEFAPSAD